MKENVKRFLLFCSGCELFILDKPDCVTERNKYAAIGATILSTAALATLSGGYAIYTVFESTPVALCLGLVWGLVIFNLDRYIVSTLRKKAAAPGASRRERLTALAQELGHALPRLVLACFISIIITRPLELKLFEREIETRVDEYNSELLAGMVRQKDAEFPELDRLAEENRRMLDELDVKEKETQSLHELAMDEAIGKEGIRTTGKVGKGIIFEERWDAFKKAESALNTLRQVNGDKVAANERRMAELRREKEQGVEGVRTQVGGRRGLLARLEAHSYLAAHNPTIDWASTFLIFLFILLETAPLIAKLLSKRGPYDEIQDALEHRVFVRERKGISDINDEANTDVSLSRQQNAGRVAAELELSRGTMASLETLASEELREARMEIARVVVEQWRRAELASLKTRGRARGGLGVNGFKTGPAAPPPAPAFTAAAGQPAADNNPPPLAGT
jgi:hypothetical protein